MQNNIFLKKVLISFDLDILFEYLKDAYFSKNHALIHQASKWLFGWYDSNIIKNLKHASLNIESYAASFITNYLIRIAYKELAMTIAFLNVICSLFLHY